MEKEILLTGNIVKHKLVVYGLTEEQVSNLAAALPEGYVVAVAECVTDLIVTNAVCTVIDAENMDEEAFRVLLARYMDVGNRLDETVVWLGDAELPEQPFFIRFGSFPELLTELDSVIAKAQTRYDTMQMYVGEYAYLPKHAIEESIEADIHASLQRKYGDTPDKEIIKRMRQELTALQETDALPELAAAYELTRWLRQNNHPFWCSGSATSGLIPYLLEITDVDPLPPHLHCPKCHHIIWKREYKDGFDIPAEVCPHCGTTLQPDGHDLVWQEYASYGRTPNYVFHTSYEQQEEIVKWVQNHWLQKLKGCDWSKATPYDQGYEYNCSIQFEPDITAVSFDEKPVAEDRDALLRIAETDWVEHANSGLPVPQSIAEAVAQEGLFKSIDSDMLCAKHLLPGGLDTTDLITCREDVFFYLKAHGFVDKDAFKGMNYVRKGRGFPVVTKEMRTARDRWVLKFCEGLSWLPSRGNILAELFSRLRAGRVPRRSGGLSTGLAAVDACIKGMRSGEVVLVGGRPAMGKASFAKGIQAHLLEQGRQVMYFDLVRQVKIENGVHYAAAPRPFAEFEKLLCEEQPELAILDRFQFLSDYDKTNETAEVLMKQIKALAMELRIPIVVLMNLNRDPETRPDPMPITSDIPHAEQILPYVDTALLLYRHAYYDPYFDRSSARCVIDKARRCRYHILPLRWDDDKYIFADVK